jgi:uncharacterized protein involved in exopolysaccharide biosynthesis
VQQETPPYPDFLQLLAWLFRSVAQRLRLVLLLALLGGAAGAITSLVLEPQFSSDAWILPPQKTNGLPDLGAASAGLEMLTGISLGSEDQSEVLRSIANSRDFRLRLLQAHKLDTLYFGSGESYQEADLQRAFGKQFAFREGEGAEFVLSFRSPSAQLSYEVVSDALTLLDSTYLALQRAAAIQTAQFLTQRIALNEKRLDSLSAAFAAFQSKNRMYAPEQQLETSVQTLAELERDQELLRIQLDKEATLHGIGTSQHNALTQELKATAKRLEQMRSQGSTSGSVLALANAPAASLRYFRLQAELRATGEISKYLQEAYEQQLLKREDNTRKIEVLQKPWLNEKRVFPPRTAITVSAAAFATVLALFLCALLGYLQAERERNSSTWQLLQQGWNSLRRR